MARDNQIKTYLDDDEADLVNQAAAALDVSTSELLRQAAISQITDDDSLPHAELAEKRRRADRLCGEIDELEHELETKHNELEDIEDQIEELEDAIETVENTSIAEAETYDEGLERIAETVVSDDGRKLSAGASNVREVADQHDKDPETVVREVYERHPRVSRRDVHGMSTSIRPREWTREYEDYDAAIDELVEAIDADDVDSEQWQEMVRDVADAFDDRDPDEVEGDVDERRES